MNELNGRRDDGSISVGGRLTVIEVRIHELETKIAWAVGGGWAVAGALSLFLLSKVVLHT